MIKNCKKRKVVILGSTGNLGAQALQVVRNYPEYFSVYGLTGGQNDVTLKKQVKESGAVHALLEKTDGMDAVCALIEDPAVDVVIHTIGGIAGLLPAWTAVRAGKIVLLANKECLVCAGSLIMKEAARSGAQIIPLDSELSAIRNCLRGMPSEMVQELILTCSGGPFWGKPTAVVTKNSVLHHPTWKMGARISVDSATLMNKGFEILETAALFDVPLERIRVLIHPQSVVHGMVTFTTGETRAVLAPPDMRVPILAALTEVAGVPLVHTDFKKLPAYPLLQFEETENISCPALDLARSAGKKGGTLPAVLCAADESGVQAFLSDQIPFSAILPFVEKTCATHLKNGFVADPSLDTLLHTLYDHRCYSGSRQKHAYAPQQTDNRNCGTAVTGANV